MLVKKLSKHGNSLALVIDKPILELLGIDENTELIISTNGRELTASPVSYASDEDVGQSWELTKKNYGTMMKNLAK
jgi:antitoxin component of MazEF toxin-antitoxin module